MIVRRSYHHVKPGKGNLDKAVALAKELGPLRKYPVRVYTPLTGAEWGVLCLDVEAESMAEWEQANAQFFASAQGQAWSERWGEVTAGGHAEFWALR